MNTLQRQSGIVLPLTLIMLTVMLIIAVTALRITGNAEVNAGNARDYEIAFQAAEVGLKTCEIRLKAYIAKIVAGGGAVSYYSDLKILPIDPMTGGKYYWEGGQNFWTDTTKVNVYAGPTGAATLANIGTSIQPRCVLEQFNLPPDDTAELVETAPAYRITARGDGARLKSSTEGFSKVYLQAIVRP